MKYTIISHFKNSELSCSCGCGMEVEADLVFALEQLRQIMGIPLIINSGARCIEHNLDSGGAVNSKHINGIAADIAWIDDCAMINILTVARNCGFHGIGVNWGKFVHLDLRGEIAFWGY